MRIIYYIKALAYFSGIFIWEDINMKMGLLGLSLLMVIFAIEIGIKEHINSKLK